MQPLPNQMMQGAPVQQVGNLNTVFDARTVDPEGGGGSLPASEDLLLVAIERSEVKETSSNGGMLVLQLRVLEGEHKGASGSDRLNLWHQTSEAAVAMAQRRLSQICHVTGKFVIGDSSELHGIPFRVKVSHQKDNPKYTEIVDVFDANGQPPRKGGPSTAPAPVAAAPVQQVQQVQQAPQAPVVQQPQQMQQAPGQFQQVQQAPQAPAAPMAPVAPQAPAVTQFGQAPQAAPAAVLPWMQGQQ